ncbi:hypothetical protein KFE25_001973 [Diacronema lutheri]|uniref:Ion transport domain-containing protein n=1 Tax=Diacronema lutheri TaxID=2081491 RepID=A0A8J5XQ26_DIALT|nr:hypothetical protein KFE25_001973 [Diacronema lutheri]
MGAKRVGADPEGPPLPSLRDLSGTSGRDIMYTSSRDLSCASGRDLSCTSGLDVPPTAPTRARSESFDSLTTEMQRATTVGSRLLLQQRAPPSWLRAAQQRLRAAYASTPAQLGLAVLIAANFVVSAVEAQLRWSTAAPSSEAAFLGIEIFFTVVFTAELLVNMAAHWLRPFWTSGWNVFDLAIIAVAWASLAADDVPGVSVLRLFRAFRVFRLFKRVHSLRSIIQGVLNAMPAIANTFGVLAIIMGIWAIIGVDLFGRAAPLDFGTFGRALLTLWQILFLDSWAQVARQLMLGGGALDDDAQPIAAPVYFVSYTFVAAIMLSNIVVAMLLDKYLRAVEGLKERRREGRAQREEAAKLESIDRLREQQRAEGMQLEERAAAKALAWLQRHGSLLSAEQADAIVRGARAEARRAFTARRAQVLSPLKAAVSAPAICAHVLTSACAVHKLVQLPRDELLQLAAVLYTSPLARAPLLERAAQVSEARIQRGTEAGDLLRWLAAQRHAGDHAPPPPPAGVGAEKHTSPASAASATAVGAGSAQHAGEIARRRRTLTPWQIVRGLQELGKPSGEERV